MRMDIWPVAMGCEFSDVILESKRLAYLDILEKELKMISQKRSLLKHIAIGTGLALAATCAAKLILL